MKTLWQSNALNCQIWPAGPQFFTPMNNNQPFADAQERNALKGKTPWPKKLEPSANSAPNKDENSQEYFEWQNRLAECKEVD